MYRSALKSILTVLVPYIVMYTQYKQHMIIKYYTII